MEMFSHLFYWKIYLTTSFVLEPSEKPPNIIIEESLSFRTAECSSLVIGKSPLDFTTSHLNWTKSKLKNFLFSYSKFEPPNKNILSSKTIDVWWANGPGSSSPFVSISFHWQSLVYELSSISKSFIFLKSSMYKESFEPSLMSCPP